MRCSKMAQTTFSADQIGRLVATTAGFSRAEIDSLCRESVMRALREDIGAMVVREAHSVVKEGGGGGSRRGEETKNERARWRHVEFLSKAITVGCVRGSEVGESC